LLVDLLYDVALLQFCHATVRIDTCDYYPLHIVRKIELPRHLSHFTPATLELVLGKAGGRIVWCWHHAKPRSYLWSLSALLRDRGWNRLAKLTESRPVYGVLKLGLEVSLPLVRLARRGEAIRVGVVRDRSV